MSYTLIIRPEAELDAELIMEWYELQREGLGQEFLISLDDGINLLTTNPEIFQERFKQTRICLLHRFPYGIYYLIQGEKIIVFAVQHHKRHSKNWKNRI